MADFVQLIHLSDLSESKTPLMGSTSCANRKKSIGPGKGQGAVVWELWSLLTQQSTNIDFALL